MIIAIILFISLFQFILIWLWGYFTISEYTDFGRDVIWITKNHTFNWVFTYFFPTHAIMYENLCERINGEGLALLLLLLSIITLPVTIIMSLIGAIVLAIRLLWQYFCHIFAREEDT